MSIKDLRKSLSSPWRECVEQAWEAYRAGSLPIGAVITDKNGRIIASGRNRLFETAAPTPYLCNTRMAHAEVNALLAFGQTGISFENTTIYTSLEPCPMCLGAIRMYRLGGIAYAARDPVAGSILLARATPFLEYADFTIHSPPDPAVEQLLLALSAESHLRLTPGTWVGWMEELDPAHLPAMQLGRKLHAANAYDQLCQDNETIWQLLPTLHSQLTL